MRTWARGTAAAACLLLAGLGLSASSFLRHPGAFLTSRAVGAVIRYFGKPYAPRWSSLSFSARAVTNRRHRYALVVRDLCAADRAGVFSACFSEFELVAIVAYGRRGPTLERVERFVASSSDARLDLIRRDPRAAARAAPAILLATPVDALRVELSSFTVVSAKTNVSGALRVALTPGARRPLAVAADLRLRDASGTIRLKGDLTAATDGLEGKPASFVDLAGRAKLGARGRVRAAFRLRRSPAGYAASGGAEFTASSGPLSALSLEACVGSAPLSPGASRPGEARLSCRFVLVPARTLHEPFENLKSASGRASLEAGLRDGRYRVALKAALAPIAAWYELGGDWAVRIDGRLDRPLREATIAHELRATAKIARFEDLVAFLRETRYAVPAPIHVLSGPLTLALETRGDPRAARQAVRYALTGDLTGRRQRLILRAAGVVTAVDALLPARSFEHAGELILKEVALELPRLDLARAPKVFTDKRIVTRIEPPPPAPAAFVAPPARGTLTVKTEIPLVLFSNLARDPVPLALDLALSYPPAAVAGRVEVRRFGVELFRRNATLDHLNVILSSGVKTGDLEGLILYDAASVRIRILILGTTEKPRVELTSVPPMKREDIIALLIFGKNPDELDSEQTASVSNTESALESRAFGLASLYLFGATPIERVGYDPVTKTTSVKLRLPGGANLTLGSDFDQSRQLTVRKPLAAHWAIQSEVTDQGREGRGAATFLEWFDRY